MDNKDNDDDNNREEEEDNVDDGKGCWARDCAQDMIATMTTTTATAARGHRHASTMKMIKPFPTLYWLTSPVLQLRISVIKGSMLNGTSTVGMWLQSLLIDGIGMEWHTSCTAWRGGCCSRMRIGGRWAAQGGWWG